MRGLWVLLASCTLAAGAAAQPAVSEKRFGIAPNTDLYPQDTPKAALESAIKLLENKRYDYFTAHLLSPDLLRAKIADRGQKLEPEVERQLVRKRDDQKRSPDREETPLPIEPKEFAVAVRKEAEERSFKYVVRDLQAQWAEYPENFRAFRMFLSEGQLAEGGAAANFTHKDLPGRAVYLRSSGKRWYLEDRQADEPKPMTDK